VNKFESRTATVFIKDQYGKFLLIWHPRWQRWMPPGGRCEPGEPDFIAAMREVKEETGIEFEFDITTLLVGEAALLPTPFAVQQELFPDNQIYNADSLYYVCVRGNSPKVTTEGSAKYRWFRADEIASMTAAVVFPDVRHHLIAIANGRYRANPITMAS